MRHTLRDLADLTLVAVPGLLTGRAGADHRARLREAAARGAPTLGGLPDRDPDPAGHVDLLLEMAGAHGCAVDLHTEATEPALLARVAAAAAGLGAGVTLGPCTGLGRLPEPAAARAAEQLAAAGVHVTCLPQGPCGLLDRAPDTPVRPLRAAGVRVAAGSGALRDAANPVGRGDPLEAAYLLASRGEGTPDEAYAAVSAHARAVLGLPPVRVAPGHPAELLAVRGANLSAALSLAYSRVTVHRGRVVARTSAVREFVSATRPMPALPRQLR